MSFIQRLKGRLEPVLPPTRDGYQPPQGATARGWRCTADDCPTERYDAGFPRGPKNCPRCGSPLEPILDEPWLHESEKYRLLALVNGAPEGSASRLYFRVVYLGWQFRDALLKGDLTAAEAARESLHRELEAYMEADPVGFEAAGRQLVVEPALKAGQFDWAADELLVWYPRTSTDDLENNSQRTNARCLFGAQLAFTEHPTRDHPAYGVIVEQLTDMAARLHQYLSTDMERRYADFLRDRTR
jgi:hypothetical protein